MRGKIVKDRASVGLVDLGHAVFVGHPFKHLIPAAAGQPLLGDNPFRMAGGAGVEGLFDAGRIEKDTELVFFFGFFHGSRGTRCPEV